MLDDKAVLRLLRSEVAKAGGQSEWARKSGVSRSLLNKVLHGRKQISSKFIKALNLRVVYIQK
jgi:DNA-binding phage protein